MALNEYVQKSSPKVADSYDYTFSYGGGLISVQRFTQVSEENPI